MPNLRHNAAATETSPSEAMRTEPMRPFPFGVTWSSLTVQLQPREIREPLPGAEATEEQTAAAVVTIVNPVELCIAEPPPPASNGRWEMVVPKMVRTGRTFTRVDPEPRPAREDDRSLAAPGGALPPPMFADYGRQPLLSKAFSLIGRRTRALLAPPPPTAEETDARMAAREAWLSKITKSLRNRSADKGDQP